MQKLSAALGVLLFTFAMKADVLSVAGSTSGRFVIGGTNINAGNPLTFGNPFDTENLRFSGTPFSVVTNPAGSTFDINLGSVTLSDSVGELEVFTADLFDFILTVNFTLPPGIGSSNPATFRAELQGVASLSGPESVEFEIAGGPQLFSFSGPQGSGSFLFEVNDLEGSGAVSEGGTRTLRGKITQASFHTPEPASAVLFATVAAGAIFSLRRRRRYVADRS